MEFYKVSPAEVLRILESNEHGLSVVEAQRKLQEQGRNSLPHAKADSIFIIFFRQFASPVIYILLIAALIVFIMGEVHDGMIILAVLFFNALIGTFQEGKAQNTLSALRSLVKTSAIVIRDNEEMLIDSEELVPGDIILLKAGDKVPADARLLEVRSLTADESALTGESEAVVKTLESIRHINPLPGDQKNMIFKGTFIIEGEGRAVVTVTGEETIIGKISEKLQGLDTDVPLKANIESLSRVIIYAVLAICTIIFIVGVFRGIAIREMFATAVAICVSAIPEGLPVVVTVILAAGMYRMSKRNALVRKLQAVEALGQASIIAVDKTGTVTLNQMMVEKLWVGETLYDVAGNGYEPKGNIQKSGLEGMDIEAIDHPDIILAGKIAAFNSSASVIYSEEKKNWERLSGDPTEAALLTFAEKIGFNRQDLEREHEKVLELPFSSKTKYHASIHKVDDKFLLSVAGAPENILQHAKHIWREGKAHELNAGDQESIDKAIGSMTRSGLRVVALGVKFDAPKVFDTGELPSLCFVGLLGISDSMRVGVHDAVLEANKAGVRVVMITGDHVETARAVARKAGIYNEGDEVITGKNLAEMSEAELSHALIKATVFARVSPEDKLKIIEAYRKRGEIIAMTGDGVNDALSLAAADLGVSMGKIGTEVAKEASDIILLDDNFGSIVGAIEEGRNIYHTIKKVILYLLSTSLGEVLTIAGALFLGFPLPVLASQIIWLNFITDGFLVAALAFEPKEKDILSHKLKKGAQMIDQDMFSRMFIMAIVMTIGSLYLFNLYLPEGFAKASTVTLTVLAVYQWVNAWNCRSEKQSVVSFDSFRNPVLIIALFIVIGLQILAVYFKPFQEILHTVPLTLFDWIVIILVSLSIVFAEEMRKLLRKN